MHFDGSVWTPGLDVCPQLSGKAVKVRKTAGGTIWAITEVALVQVDLAAKSCTSFLRNVYADEDAFTDLVMSSSGQLWVLSALGNLFTLEGDVLSLEVSASTLAAPDFSAANLHALAGNQLRFLMRGSNYVATTLEIGKSQLITVDLSGSSAKIASEELPFDGSLWIPDATHELIALRGGVLTRIE
jgi:hypothetical protein